MDHPYPEDPWLERFTGVAALRAALALGWLDRLAAGPAEASALAAEGPAAAELLDILAAEGVVVRQGGAVALAPRFAQVHAARGRALRARLDFLARAAADLIADPGAVFADLPRHMARSQTFRLYRYDLAQTDDAAGSMSAP